MTDFVVTHLQFIAVESLKVHRLELIAVDLIGVVTGWVLHICYTRYRQARAGKVDAP